MVRDGQTYRDYGYHHGPPPEWSAYAECQRCKVARGAACIDLRYKHAPAVHNHKPHVGRELVNPLAWVGAVPNTDTRALK